MKFGVGVDYSIKALLMLAEHHSTAHPLRVEEIAVREAIPENYLRRLLIELKRAGLVASQKGPSGGYMLARPAARITIDDVVQAIEGDYAPVEYLEDGQNAPRRRDESSAMRDVWREVHGAVAAVLKRTTLQSLADRRKTALHFQI